jgi:MFS family permease
MSLSTFSPADRRNNRIGILLDYIFFTVGLTFAGVTTTLPAFAARLTGNPILIGLVGMVWMGGWLLPQTFAANYLSAIQRKMPILIGLRWSSQPVFIFFILYLFLSGAVWPALTLGLLYFACFFFTFTDSIAGLVWFDVLGKAFSNRERGRLIGLGQALAGIFSIVAGIIIGWVLEGSGLAFPNDYALILVFADICFLASLLGNYLIREPVEPVASERQKMIDYLPGLIRLIRRDKLFRQVNVSRLLVGFCGMAAPFFAVFAIRGLGLPEGAVGFFAIAQTVGLAAAGILQGWIADRKGPQSVIRVMGGMYFLSPCFVLAAGLLGGSSAFATFVMSAAFFSLGLGDGSIVLGYFNYILDIAPPELRPVYFGLTNSLVGVTVFYPFLGGALADLGGYRIVFILAAIGIAAGWAVGFSLPKQNATSSLAENPPQAIAEGRFASREAAVELSGGIRNLDAGSHAETTETTR